MTHTSTAHGIITIGAKVRTADDKDAGVVSRVIVDAAADLLTDVVVRSGSILTTERVVPLGLIRNGDSEQLWLDIGKDAFEELNGFDPQLYPEADPDYVGPPGWDRGGLHPRNFELNSFVAMGSLAGMGQPAKPLGYPGGEPTAPGRMARPAIEAGTAVLDCTGEKIGEVRELAMSAETGEPERLVVRQGFLFHTDTELPPSWIAELTDVGVILNVARDRVEAGR